MCVESMTLARRATDHGEPTNGDIFGRLNEFIAQHQKDHSDLESRLATHESKLARDLALDNTALASRLAASDTALATRLATADTNAALRQDRLGRLEAGIPELSELHDFRVQVETIGASVKWVLGGSLIAALAAIASLVVTFAHIVQSAPH